MILRFLPATALGLAAFAVLALPAGAEKVHDRPKAVVELFTSQGCAQCPPADALLTSLAEEGDVIALAYHVDYWDYVGWEDTFGKADYSDRQRAYAKSWGSSRIYTPQMVVNGDKGVVGSRRNEVHGALDRATLSLSVDITRQDDMLKIAVPPNAALPLAVDIDRDGDMLKVTIPPNTSLEDAVVWMVTYLDRADVAIDKGENAGKTMVYTQVVTSRQPLGLWEGATGANLKLPLPEILDDGSTGIAVIVQQESNGLPGPILGAATYER